MTMTITTEDAVVAGTTTITLTGELDARTAPELNTVIERAARSLGLQRVVLDLGDLTYMSSAGVRCLVFAHQKLPGAVGLELHDVRSEVAETVRLTGFHHSITLLEVESARVGESD